MASVTTICLVGFPADGVPPRELKNLCRFMPGFEGAHVAFAGVGISSLFVKFESSDLATAAIETLNGVPFDLDNPQFIVKAEWARREMEVRRNSPLPPAANAPFHGAPARPPPPRAYGAPAAGYQGPPSQRVGTTGGELVTIVVFGLKEKGLQRNDMELFFQERPGYVSLQMNERIDGMFVRFTTAQMAEQAMNEANSQGVGAEWARRNLDDDRSGGQMATYQPQAPAPAAAWGGGGGGGGGGSAYAGPPSKRVGATGGELVTICVLGLASKDISAEQLQDHFAQRPGFDRQQLNDRIGGLFVKFTSAPTAEEAMHEANGLGWGAEWARRNLDDDLGNKQSAPPAYQQHYQQPHYQQPHYQQPAAAGGPPPKRMRAQTGEIDTITILGIREKEQAHGSLQQWFAEKPGYVMLQVNDKIDAMFIKFSSTHHAEQAMHEANSDALGCEWARRNLDL